MAPTLTTTKKPRSSLLILVPGGGGGLTYSQILNLKRAAGVDKIKMSHDKRTIPVVN